MKKLIFLSLIILFLTKTQNVFAKIDTFTVDNITVVGKMNSNNYREKYLQVAFKKSFENLTNNILKKKDQKKLLSTDLKTIKSLIENYQIIQEETLDDIYTIKVSMTFNRDLVNQFFRRKNITYSEVTKLELIVFPILILNSELQVFSQNKFFKEWNEQKNFENINFILPVENVDDIEVVKNNLQSLLVKKVMTKKPITISKDILAAKALSLMNSKKITCLCVNSNKSKHKTIGLIHIHNILEANVQ